MEELKAKGNELYKTRRFEDAVAAYTEAVALDPTSPTAAVCLSNRAASLLALNRAGDALADCGAALALDGSNARAASRAGTTLLKLGALDAAKPLLDRASAAGGDVADALQLWTAAGGGGGGADTAPDRWQQAAVVLPRAPLVHLGLARARIASRQFTSAVTAGLAALSLASEQGVVPSSSPPGPNAIVAPWDAGEASMVLLRAVVGAGDLDRAASAEVARGVPHAAVRDAVRQAAAAKAAANDAYRAGAFDSARDKYGEAMAALDAVGLQSAVLHANMAACHVAQAAHADAVRECGSSLALFPYQAKVLARRAGALEATGNTADAVADLTAAAYLAPTLPSVAESLDRLRGAAPTAVADVEGMDHWRRLVAAAGPRPIVVDFYATWCGPCKMVAPAVDAFSKRYPTAVFLKVDVDKCDDIAAQARVSAMPTFMVYRNGAQVDTLKGADVGALHAMITRRLDWPAGTAVDTLPPPTHLPVWPPK